MNIRTIALALPILGLVSGCSTVEGWFGDRSPPPRPVAANPPPTPPAPPPPAPAVENTAPAGLDGRYAGQLRLARNQARTCRPASIPVSATVNGGRVALNAGRYGTTEGTINADGSVALTGDDGSASGRFANNRLTGTAERNGCSYNVMLQRRR